MRTTALKQHTTVASGGFSRRTWPGSLRPQASETGPQFHPARQVNNFCLIFSQPLPQWTVSLLKHTLPLLWHYHALLIFFSFLPLWLFIPSFLVLFHLLQLDLKTFFFLNLREREREWAYVCEWGDGEEGERIPSRFHTQRAAWCRAPSNKPKPKSIVRCSTNRATQVLQYIYCSFFFYFLFF